MTCSLIPLKWNFNSIWRKWIPHAWNSMYPSVRNPPPLRRDWANVTYSNKVLSEDCCINIFFNMVWYIIRNKKKKEWERDFSFWHLLWACVKRTIKVRHTLPNVGGRRNGDVLGLIPYILWDSRSGIPVGRKRHELREKEK